MRYPYIRNLQYLFIYNVSVFCDEVGCAGQTLLYLGSVFRLEQQRVFDLILFLLREILLVITA